MPQPRIVTEGAWTLEVSRFPRGFTVRYWQGARPSSPPSTNCYPDEGVALARAREGIAHQEAGAPRLTATFTATIGGVSREIEVVERSAGRQEEWQTEGAIALARTPQGNRLWPMRLVFIRDRAGQIVMKESGYTILNTSNGSLVAWNEEELARLVSRHNGAATSTTI